MDATRRSVVVEPGSPRHSVTWAWGARAETRIDELRTDCLLAMRPNAPPDAQALANEAREYLEHALQIVRQGPKWWQVLRNGASVDAALTNMNAAACLVLRCMPLDELEGRLPDVVALLAEHLPQRDPRRIQVEELLRRSRRGSHLNEFERVTVVTAVRAALTAKESEHVRVRSFRNLVLGATISLTALALAIGILTALRPALMPICFMPDGQIVCPTASMLHDAGGDPDQAIAGLVSGWDYIVIEVVGVIAAALAAAVALRQVRGSSVPHGVPLALALLKLPSGALTAVLGLLLMRGEFFPGLAALDSSAQILAWAVIFGYSQQLLTGLVDRRGQAVLKAVGGPQNPLFRDAGV